MNDCINLRTFWEYATAHALRRIVIFGASRWGELVYEELRKGGVDSHIVFADNDRTKYGLTLLSQPILSPQELDPLNDIVIIGTISAGPELSAQLESLGFVRDSNYFEVLHNLGDSYPQAMDKFFTDLCGAVSNLDVLHVGPGGNLGYELLLALHGAKSVTSVEAYSYRLYYPDVTAAQEFYLAVNTRCNKYLSKDLFESELLYWQSDKLFINESRIKLYFPCSVTAMPFAENFFDRVYHHAVFEHVLDPGKGYQEIYRVLRPAGIMAGMVDPQDHRAQASIEGYHPLKFLELSRDDWQEINSSINPHNQVTTPEHREMIEQCGFSVELWRDEKQMEVTTELYNTFHPMFHRFSAAELSVLRFSVVAKK